MLPRKGLPLPAFVSSPPTIQRRDWRFFYFFLLYFFSLEQTLAVAFALAKTSKILNR